MLNQLQAGAIALSIFSNKPQEFTSLNVAGLLGKWQFAVVLGASAATPRKPDCSGALRIARELALPPADFIYLGDSGIDMQTAVRAGMYGVGALWGFRTAEELRANGAKSLAQKPQDILQFFA
jgi:phosphoglycolate phosphatase